MPENKPERVKRSNRGKKSCAKTLTVEPGKQGSRAIKGHESASAAIQQWEASEVVKKDQVLST
jgi:hypothetical protein